MFIRNLRILAVSLMLCAAADRLVGQVTLTNLYSFTNSPGGANPVALMQGSDGNFYGTTSYGGTNGLGTVFEITTNGYVTILHSFTNNPDGYRPFAGLVQGSDGNFYGTTHYGGQGYGIVFQITTNGNETILHSFTNNPDGATPDAGLVQGSDGNFYGTTHYGGNGVGTVFQITTNGNVTILHSFTNYPDGQEPIASLAQGSDGNFYSTTYMGGTNGLRTVFQITTNGNVTILHSFPSFSGDGERPAAWLTQGSDGNFYGTCEGPSNMGTVFRISPNGSYSNLYSFSGLNAVYSGLVQGSDGDFYGTTGVGGQGYGTIFRISPSGSFSNLYSFNGSSSGEIPNWLVQGSDGNYYGTTGGGGPLGVGTVFKLVVPLSPAANQISAIEVAGMNVLVAIPSVAAETYQLQYQDSLIIGGWSNIIGASATSIGGSLTMTNFGGALPSQRFYRFAITP